MLAARWTACRKLREHPRRAISRRRHRHHSTIWDRISLGSPFITERAQEHRALRDTALVGAVGRLRGCVRAHGAAVGSNRCPGCSFFNELARYRRFWCGVVSENLCSLALRARAGAYRQPQTLVGGNATGCALIARPPALSRTHKMPPPLAAAALHWCTRPAGPSRTAHAWLRGTRGRRRRMGQPA